MEANGANAGTVLMLSSFGIALGRGIEFDPRFDPKPIKKMNQLSKKFRHPLTLGIFLFAGIAGASPISYSISFTLNPTSAGPLPSGGSFTYDSAGKVTVIENARSNSGTPLPAVEALQLIRRSK